MDKLPVCEVASILKTIRLIRIGGHIIFILIPIVIIIRSIMDAFKVISTGSSDEARAKGMNVLKRIFIGLLIFLIPYLFEGFISLGTNIKLFKGQLKYCLENSSTENIEKYEKLEGALDKVALAKLYGTQESVNEAAEAIYEILPYVKEEYAMDLMQGLSELQNIDSNGDKVSGCAKIGGTYDGGYCFIIGQNNGSGGNGNNGNNGNNDGNGGNGGNGNQGYNNNNEFPETGSGTGTITMDYLGVTWIVPNTKVSVKNYMNFISKSGFYESINISRYGDHCLGFAYAHSYGLYTGNQRIGAENGHDYWGASRFKGYVNDDKKQVLKLVYQEINAGRPIIIQVNGNSKGTSRHYVSVVGYNSRVKSVDQLTEDDLLIIDSYDGKTEKNGKANKGRFMITGAACHKKYSGYQAYYIKPNYYNK